MAERGSVLAKVSGPEHGNQVIVRLYDGAPAALTQQVIGALPPGAAVVVADGTLVITMLRDARSTVVGALRELMVGAHCHHAVDCVTFHATAVTT